MRRAARVDDNQVEIVNALRKMGCAVEHLHSQGKGCPDLLVGVCGINLLLEIKDGEKFKSQRNLTKHQIKWHEEWRGQVKVIESIDDAVNFINSIRTQK